MNIPIGLRQLALVRQGDCHESNGNSTQSIFRNGSASPLPPCLTVIPGTSIDQINHRVSVRMPTKATLNDQSTLDARILTNLFNIR